MQGTRPRIELVVYLDEHLILSGLMKRDMLPCRAPLTQFMRTLLRADARTQGQRTPKRLHLGRFCRTPYHYYSMRAGRSGLRLPDGLVTGHLTMELHIAAFDPLFDLPLHYYLRGCELVQYPAVKRTLWVPHKYMTPVAPCCMRHHEHHETPCGRFVDIRVCL